MKCGKIEWFNNLLVIGCVNGRFFKWKRMVIEWLKLYDVNYLI